MTTAEDIFNLIKKKRNFLSKKEDYKIKISDSNNFEKENLINIYKIRKYAAIRNENQKLSQQINNLILNLENYYGDNLRFVTILGKTYYGMFYLSQNWKEIIGYLESDIDESGNLILNIKN